MPLEVAAIYMLGHDHGHASAAPEVERLQHELEQACWEADRLYLTTMNPAERAAEIVARMEQIDTSSMTEAEAIEAMARAGLTRRDEDRQ